MLPPFDARDLPLSRDARSQLGGVYDSLLATGKIPQSKARLHGALLAHAYLPARGTYMVLSSDVELFRKLPTYSKAAQPTQGPFPTCYFSNALVIPGGFGEPGFDAARATKPSMRAANIGMIIVTHEFDCETSDQLEENLEWTRKGGRKMAPILQVATELKQYRDFMGVTAVFSGSRSIHFHFAFSTDHFQHAPVHPNAAARGTSEQHADSALLDKAHNVLWDCVGDTMERVLSPSMACDKQMRSLTKYRRAPFGIRVLDKPSTILQLPSGTPVPQIVLIEDQRLERASKGSRDYIIAPDFSVARLGRSGGRATRRTSGGEAGDDVVEVIKEICAAEFGPFPQPAKI